MIKQFQEFNYTSSHGIKWSKQPGAFMVHEATQEKYVFKFMSDTWSVREVFASALFLLFAGSRHSPQVDLVEGTPPHKSAVTEYMVASKFRSGYTSFQDAAPFLSPSNNQQLLNGKPIEGLELLTLISVLLRELDFYGNGNIGFHVSDDLPDAPAYRIDFGQTLINNKPFDMASLSSIGEGLDFMNCMNMIRWNLFNREKTVSALRAITAIPDSALDELFEKFKPYFEIAIEREKIRLRKNMEEAEHPVVKNSWQNVINEHDEFISKLKQQVEQIKNDKHILQERIKEFTDPPQAQTSFFVHKEVKPEKAATFNAIRAFYDFIDKFNTSLYPNYADRATTLLINEIKRYGRQAPKYMEYLQLKERWVEIFDGYKKSYEATIGQLTQVNNLSNRNDDFKPRYEKQKADLLAYLEWSAQNIKQFVAPMESLVAKSDYEIGNMLPPLSASFQNKDVNIVVQGIAIDDFKIVFTVNTKCVATSDSAERAELLRLKLELLDVFLCSEGAEVHRIPQRDETEVISYTINDLEKAKILLKEVQNWEDNPKNTYPTKTIFLDALNYLNTQLRCIRP